MIDQKKLSLILSEHSKWLKSEGGSRANLRNANLRNANLRGADLRNTNLRNADLFDANLREADLHGADLREANLHGANLRGANLRNVNLFDGFVSDGVFHHVTNIGSEKGVLELYSCGEKGWLVRRGCFTGTKSEFLAKVKETHGNNEHAVKYLALINALCGSNK